MTRIEDITASGLAHAPGPEDRVFRITSQPTEFAPDGVYVAKVKREHDPASQVGLERLNLTVSLCDATGRALRTAKGAPFVLGGPPHQHTIGSDPLRAGEEPVDVVAALSEIERQVALRVVTAVINRFAVRSLTAGAQPRSLQ